MFKIKKKPLRYSRASQNIPNFSQSSLKVPLHVRQIWTLHLKIKISPTDFKRPIKTYRKKERERERERERET